MAKEVEEERRISPVVIVPVAIAGLLGIAAIAYVATREEAPPAVYKCPYCGDIGLPPENRSTFNARLL